MNPRIAFVIAGIVLLGTVFVVLKLAGVIGWSWWLVTMPWWGGAALIVALLLFAMFAYVFLADWSK